MRPAPAFSGQQGSDDDDEEEGEEDSEEEEEEEEESEEEEEQRGGSEVSWLAGWGLDARLTPPPAQWRLLEVSAPRSPLSA